MTTLTDFLTGWFAGTLVALAILAITGVRFPLDAFLVISAVVAGVVVLSVLDARNAS